MAPTEARVAFFQDVGHELGKFGRTVGRTASNIKSFNENMPQPLRTAAKFGLTRVLGNDFGGALSKFVGTGAYSRAVKNELIDGGQASEGIMRFDHASDRNALVLSHSEYVQDVYSPSVPNGTADIVLPLNAGLASTFPMMSQLAANFEEFKIMQLAFTYRPSLSDWNTANGQVGMVIIATQYNANAQTWSTKEQMLSQTGSTSSRTIDSAWHGVECDVNKLHSDGKFLTRTGPPAVSGNLSDFDLGFTQVRIMNCPAGNLTLGELHVSYTVELSKPRIWASLGMAIPSFRTGTFRVKDGSTITPVNQGATTTGSTPLGANVFVPHVYRDDDLFGMVDQVAPLATASGSVVNGFPADIVPKLNYFQQNSFDSKMSTKEITSVRFTGQTATQDDASIGSGCHGLVCTFPAHSTGFYEVKIDVEVEMTIGSEADMRNIVMGKMGHLVCRLDGNVWPVYDLSSESAYLEDPSYLAGSPIEDSYVMKDLATNGTARMLFSRIMHVRSTIATNQVENGFTLMLWDPVQSGTSTGTISFDDIDDVRISVAQYNPASNTRMDGTNDQPLVIDSLDQLVRYPNKVIVYP